MLSLLKIHIVKTKNFNALVGRRWRFLVRRMRIHRFNDFQPSVAAVTVSAFKKVHV